MCIDFHYDFQPLMYYLVVLQSNFVAIIYHRLFIWPLDMYQVLRSLTRDILLDIYLLVIVCSIYSM